MDWEFHSGCSTSSGDKYEVDRGKRNICFVVKIRLQILGNMSAKSKIILDTFISQKRFLRAGRLGLGVLNSNVMRPAGHGPHNQSWMLKR